MIAKYPELDSKVESSMKSLLIGFALILCMAKVAKFFASFFVLKKKNVRLEPVRRQVRTIVIQTSLECDKSVSELLSTLVPTNVPTNVQTNVPTNQSDTRKHIPDTEKLIAFRNKKREHVNKCRLFVKDRNEQASRRQLCMR